MQFSINATHGISAGGAGSSVTGLTRTNGTVAGSNTASDSSTPFTDLFTDAVGQIDQLEDQARVAAEGMMTGSGADVHQVMIATQKASMAFDLALAVRNKAVQAYQSVMGMQF